MIIKDFNRDKFGILFLSTIRNCLTTLNDDDFRIVHNIFVKNELSFEKRDIFCSLQDCLDDSFYSINGMEKSDYFNAFRKDLFKNAIVLTHGKGEHITAYSILEVLRDCKYFLFRQYNYVKDGDICQKFIDENLELIASWEKEISRKYVQDEVVDIDIEQDELEFLLFNAFHYAIGRRTYVVDYISSLLLHFKDNLSSITKNSIVEYIKERKEKDDTSNDDFKTLGDDCDRKCWLKVMEEFQK